MVLSLAERCRPWEALYIWLGFMTYLRPSELFSLTIEQVILPVHGLGRGAAGCSLLVYPVEGLRPGKTGEFDHSVPLDLPHLQPLALTLEAALRGLPGS